MKILRFLLLFFIVYVVNIIAVCLPEFEEVGSQCYLFAENPSSWEDAKSYCKQLSVAHSQNIDLAMLDINVAENQYFLEVVKTKKSAYWVGGKDEEGQGHWFWEDDREISTNANYWYLTEPKNSNGIPGCAMANITKGHHFDRVYLYSQDCTNQLPFICHAQDVCPHGFQRIGMSCYFFSSGNGAPMLPWQSARDFCLTIDVPNGQVDLARLGIDEDTDQELLNVIASKGERVIIGASQTEEDTWVWLDGRSLSLDSYFWHFNNPNDEGDGLYVDVEYNKAMIADCSKQLTWHFVCQVL